jgi:hypothetical protein
MPALRPYGAPSPGPSDRLLQNQSRSLPPVSHHPSFWIVTGWLLGSEKVWTTLGFYISSLQNEIAKRRPTCSYVHVKAKNPTAAELLEGIDILCAAVHGRVGDHVFKTYGEKIIVTRMPCFDGYVPSAAQRKRREKMRAATAYAQAVYANPTAKAVYVAAAKPLGRQPFRLAVADFLRDRPRIAVAFGLSRPLPQTCASVGTARPVARPHEGMSSTGAPTVRVPADVPRTKFWPKSAPVRSAGSRPNSARVRDGSLPRAAILRVGVLTMQRPQGPPARRPHVFQQSTVLHRRTNRGQTEEFNLGLVSASSPVNDPLLVNHRDRGAHG